MKILIVTPYRSNRGGVETLTNILSEGLKDLNYQVDYLTLEDCQRKKILHKIFGLPFILKKKLHQKAKDFDFILANGEFGAYCYHPKLIVYFHGSYKGLRQSNHANLSWKNKLALIRDDYLQRRSARNAWRVIAVSEYIKNILKTQKIFIHQIINPPVDSRKFHLIRRDQRLKHLLFVGSNSQFKGVDVLVRWAREALEMGIEIHCIGADDFPAPLINLGKYSQKELNEIYNQYSLLIFPSRFESWGQVVTEAMASGLAVLMGEVGVSEELKEEFPEFVVQHIQSRSWSEIYPKIEALQAKWSYYQERGPDFVRKKLNLKKFLDSWDQVFKS